MIKIACTTCILKSVVVLAIHSPDEPGKDLCEVPIDAPSSSKCHFSVCKSSLILPDLAYKPWEVGELSTKLIKADPLKNGLKHFYFKVST
jgi:hypothetical protein